MLLMAKLEDMEIYHRVPTPTPFLYARKGR
jgi:hypothetical protein